MKMLPLVMLGLVLLTSLIPAATFAQNDLEAVIEVQHYEDSEEFSG